MRAVIDTDIFGKLACSGLFEDALQLLGLEMPDCARLSALPYMLRKGRLRKLFGPAGCDMLLRLVERMPALTAPSDNWLAPLASATAIDAGEAMLIAAAAQHRCLLVTGDKRSLRELSQMPTYTQALSGRVVTLECLLLALADALGTDELVRRAQPLCLWDTMARACLRGTDPRLGLVSYAEDAVRQTAPLDLWKPSALEVG